MVTRWGGRWSRAALMAVMGVVMVVVLGPTVVNGLDSDESDHGTATSDHPMIAPLNPPAVPAYGELAVALTKARSATVKYATDLRVAQADGYKVITPMMPQMGVHYLNYIDGQFIPGPQTSCTLNHPASSAPFFFWHPDLVTLHVWLWHPNPNGIFHDTNPLIAPYD
jgi:hypothetical protein